MTLQARMSEGDPRLYNPSRDVAHNFQEVMELVAGRLEDHAWPELTEVLEREGISLDDLGEACGAYCVYVASAANEDLKGVTMVQAMKVSGFLDCKPAAQVAVMAMIGVCIAGIQFEGVREATVGGVGPLATIADVGKHAERLQSYVGVPRWKRKLIDFKGKVSQSIRTFRS